MKIQYRLALYIVFVAASIFTLEQFRIDNVPDPDDVVLLTIEGDGETADISDEAFISVLLGDIENAKNTLRSSNNDQPMDEPYWTLTFQTAEGGTDTYYFYESRWFSYIERPYDGIYTIDSVLLEYIHLTIQRLQN